jgi:hypothetical protein
MTAMIITKDLSKANTASVCECYLKGDIVEMPKLHIDKMMKILTNGMKRYIPGGSYCHFVLNFDISKESDIRLMIDRYLHYTYTNRYQKRFNPEYKITKAGNKILKITSVITDYYEDIKHYRLGSIDFEGEKIDIYFNIPIKYKHYSLTCFHTDPDSMNQYYFKNLHNILPSDELIEQFMLQIPPQRVQTPEKDNQTVVKYSF